MCHAPVKTVLLVLASVTSQADDSTVHPASHQRGFQTGGKKARLVESCRGLARSEKMTIAEYEKYCRWVVRVAPESGTRSRSFSPEDERERERIENALAPLTAVQPPQIKENRASILAQRPGALAGEFTIVSMSKIDGTWRVESMIDSRPGRLRRAP